MPPRGPVALVALCVLAAHLAQVATAVVVSGCPKCAPDASCVVGQGGLSSCVCDRGFTGDGAKGCVDANDCSPNPCANRGTCIDTGTRSFKCTCVGGFTGVTCRNNVDTCDAPANNNDHLPTMV